MLRIYGTVTSPYVRRVRVVAHELGVAYELFDTASAEGQARLRALSPIWKVPAAELDGQFVLDSHAITELLLLRHGPGPLASLPIEAIDARNAIAVVDGALDALINAFYLGQGGVRAADVPYVQKQQDRAAHALAWLEVQVDGMYLTKEHTFGLPEIALGTSLAWMRFRDAYPIDRHPHLCAALDALEARPSFQCTQPTG